MGEALTWLRFRLTSLQINLDCRNSSELNSVTYAHKCRVGTGKQC